MSSFGFARTPALALLALATAAGAALAQPRPATPAQAPPASKDTQAKFEPPSGPGAGQAFLKQFEGEWTVERNFYPPGGGAPNRATGECTQKMVQDGRFLQSDFTFHQDGKTTTGTGISGFDPQTGLFTTFWYDARSTKFSIRQSRDPFDGKQIVLYSASLAATHGQEHPSRTVSHLEDSGRKLIHQQFNQGADGKEHLLMELILTRKPAHK
ncbi:MAG TPA: DUF1579 family protein [Kofleriaceae bacterium]|nr:DUF1579 family protein [Kofleriaceae bacterium]